MNSRQRGMIEIPYVIVRENPQFVFDIFYKIGFLPVEVVFNMSSGVMLYTGYSRRFEECQYSQSPRYCGVIVTVREPGVVLDADVTFNGESYFSNWEHPKAEVLAYESGEPF